MSETPEPHAAGTTAPPIADVALKGRCPRCGAPALVFSTFNVGDGPAAFLTLIVGAVVVTLAITLELTVHPPLWLHMVIWIPVTAAAVIVLLRMSKAALLALEYRNKAGEGRREDAR